MTAESCPTITPVEEPAYTIYPTDEDFCNPSSDVVMVFLGLNNYETLWYFNGDFNFGVPVT